MNTLLHAKKTFIDTYGEVPPMIGFLGIDTDSNQYAKALSAVDGRTIILEPNEQCPIHVRDARPTYDLYRARLSWLPEENVFALDSMMYGAGAVRTNGRFAFTVNRDYVATAVQNKLDAIQNANIAENVNYAPIASQDAPEIHMVFSICGGTGAGTFINMAYLLHQVAPGCKIHGYAVLPNVFASIDRQNMPRIKPNAYGSLLDLDYLMHLKMSDTPVTIHYLSDNNTHSTNKRPFNSITFIDNKNGDNDVYNKIDHLAEMISLALVSASGVISGGPAGDNDDKDIAQGLRNIENKVAWASGLGTCEIVYRGDVLAQIYQMKAAQNLIDRLTNSTVDADIIANNWIDSVKIRENNGKDDVINAIAPVESNIAFCINKKKDPRGEVDFYIANCEVSKEAIRENSEAIKKRVEEELTKLMIEYTNREGGVALAKKILVAIKTQIQICAQQMSDEKAALEKDLPAYKSNIDAIISDISSVFMGIGLSKKCDDLADAVKIYTNAKRDIQRHEAAIDVYNAVFTLLEKHSETISNIENLLTAVHSNLTKGIATLQKGAKENHIFQINLAAEEARNITIEPSEIIILNFLKTLDGESKIYGLVDYSTNKIEELIINYTKTLSGAYAYLEKGVEEALKEIKDRDENEFKQIISLAIKKSKPLFCYDYQAHRPELFAADRLCIGVYDYEDSILNGTDDYFKNAAAKERFNSIDWASIGMKDKIIIYRRVGVVPAYTIEGIERFRGEYSQCRVNCHFDANILDKMRREGFSLKPVVINNNDMLDLWVMGFVYGLIKNENKCYYMKSKTLGDPLKQYWVELAPWRNEAFEEFKRHELEIVREFNEHITTENEKMGADAVAHRIADVKANYYEKYSQINISMTTLQSHGYEKVAALMRDELHHIENNL